MANLGRRTQDKGVFPGKGRRNLGGLTEHRMQTTGEFAGGAAPNRGLAGGDNVVRELLILLRSLWGKGGVTKPTLLSGLGMHIRTQDQQ